MMLIANPFQNLNSNYLSIIESNDFRIQIVTSTFNHDFMKQFIKFCHVLDCFKRANATTATKHLLFY